ncbi:transposase [Enterococcus mundtii]|uniref:transposase n=1 Tax=Enterococcus mundtii TaxID=53346 RepID=UPI003D7FE416
MTSSNRRKSLQNILRLSKEISFLVADMHPDYLQPAKCVLPNTSEVIDRCHIVKYRFKLSVSCLYVLCRKTEQELALSTKKTCNHFRVNMKLTTVSEHLNKYPFLTEVMMLD